MTACFAPTDLSALFDYLKDIPDAETFLTGYFGADRSRWPDFCGEYETNYDSFRLERVFMEGDKLLGRASNEDREGFVFRLIPVADDRFIRKDGMAELKFGDGCVVIDGVECRKK